MTGEQKAALINADGTPTPEGWRKLGVEFRKEMPSKDYTAGGKKMSYITARQVQDRLDGVIGPGNWQSCFRVLDVEQAAVECTLTIFGVSKSDVGYKNNPEAQPGDRQYELEPLKAAYSDSFKRAAVAWGIGRFLHS